MIKAKRSLLFRGFVINIVLLAILFLVYFGNSIIFFSLNERVTLLNIKMSNSVAGLLHVLLTIINLFALITSAIGISLCSKPLKVYQQRKKFIILSIVSMYFIALFHFVDMFSNSSSIIFFFTSVNAATLTLMGYTYKPSEEPLIEEIEIIQPNNQSSNIDEVYYSIEKLHQLKENNLITEAEFTEFSKVYLDQLKSE